MIWTQVIKKPVFTEKSVKQQEHGVYTFIVHADSTKTDVKLAIDKLYGIKVKSVNMEKLGTKLRMLAKGRFMTRRHQQKRARITLRSGDKLDIGKFNK